VTGPAAPAFEVQESSPDPSSVERLLRLLPEWFGIESSIVSYVEDARYEETVLARPAGAPQAPAIGALLLRTHFPEAAEIHLLAVEPAWHRQGVGSALVHHAEERLEARGVGVLSVKTLGPSSDSKAYAATRSFYEAIGFLRVEELRELWPGNPCLLMVKALSQAPAGRLGK
jgi:ribosomal protein S18 acetylase RimI-like enzyme